RVHVRGRRTVRVPVGNVRRGCRGPGRPVGRGRARRGVRLARRVLDEGRAFRHRDREHDDLLGRAGRHDPRVVSTGRGVYWTPVTSRARGASPMTPVTAALLLALAAPAPKADKGLPKDLIDLLPE